MRVQKESELLGEETHKASVDRPRHFLVCFVSQSLTENQSRGNHSNTKRMALIY